MDWSFRHVVSMGVILAIALDLATADGGWASVEPAASLMLATLAALGLWLRGRARDCHAAGAAGGDASPGFARALVPAAAWRRGLLLAAPSPAPATPVLLEAPDVVPSPDLLRARPSRPSPAASSSPLRAPPAPGVDVRRVDVPPPSQDAPTREAPRA